jgi:hypothetical protein
MTKYKTPFSFHDLDILMSLVQLADIVLFGIKCLEVQILLFIIYFNQKVHQSFLCMHYSKSNASSRSRGTFLHLFSHSSFLVFFSVTNIAIILRCWRYYRQNQGWRYFPIFSFLQHCFSFLRHIPIFSPMLPIFFVFRPSAIF